MEHMLLNLLNHALMQSPANAEIPLEFHADGEVGEIVIDSGLSLSPHSVSFGELPSGLQRWPGGPGMQAVDSLALAKFCADNLGHELQGCLMDNNRL